MKRPLVALVAVVLLGCGAMDDPDRTPAGRDDWYTTTDPFNGRELHCISRIHGVWCYDPAS